MNSRGISAVLKQLSKSFHGGHARSSLLDLLRLSPLLPELSGVWTAQATIKNQKILSALMDVYSGLLRIHTSSGGTATDSNPEYEGDDELILAVQLHHSDNIIKTRMKVKACV